MRFFKNIGIKAVTKKRTRRIIGLIQLAIENEPNIITDGNSFIMEVLKNYVNVVEIRGETLNRLNEINRWYEYFGAIIILEVLAELSYDPTMGDEKDFELIEQVFDEEIRSWKSRSKILMKHYEKRI